MSSLLIMLLIFAGLLLLQVPVAFAMLASSVSYMLIDGLFPVTVIIQRMAPGLESFPFLAISTFILAGNLLNQTGVANRIFAFALSLVGHIRGSRRRQPRQRPSIPRRDTIANDPVLLSP